MKNYTYESTYEGVSLLTLGTGQIKITYTIDWGQPPIIHLAPEHCDPGSGDAVEISCYEIETFAIDTYRWRKAGQAETEALDTWAEGLHDDLIEEAKEQEQDNREANAEARADARREDW